MPLTPVDAAGYETAQGVHFAMRRGDITVRVFVTRPAIMGTGEGDQSCLERFEAARGFFEILAREKFDPHRPYAKIAIGMEDLLGPAAQE